MTTHELPPEDRDLVNQVIEQRKNRSTQPRAMLVLAEAAEAAGAREQLAYLAQRARRELKDHAAINGEMPEDDILALTKVLLINAEMNLPEGEAHVY